MKTRYLLGISLFFVLFTVSLLAVDLSAPVPMDPDLRYGKLENGFTYYIKANRMPEKRAELRLYVNSGSVQEDEDQKGLAHFGEHMAFNGTKNFPKQQLLEYLNSIGMGFQGGLNGGTSYDFVTYQLQVPTDDAEAMDKGFLIISDWAHAISFEPEDRQRARCDHGRIPRRIECLGTLLPQDQPDHLSGFPLCRPHAHRRSRDHPKRTL